ALPDAYLLRRDVFHPAHQAEAFVAIDQRNIERLALDGMHDRRGVDCSEPFTDAPFQPITASEGTKHARVKDGPSRLGAELIGQLTAREMIEIGLERSVPVPRHACQYPGDYSPKRFCSAVATGRSTVVCILTLARPQSCNWIRPGNGMTAGSTKLIWSWSRRMRSHRRPNATIRTLRSSCMKTSPRIGVTMKNAKGIN